MIENKNETKEMLEIAKQELHSAQYAKIKNKAVCMKNEVLEMIAKVRKRKGRLDLPIVSGKHLRKISNRTALQPTDNAEKFITTRKIDSFENLANFTADKEQKYGQLIEVRRIKGAYGEPFTEWRKNNAKTVENGGRKKFNANFIVNTNSFLYN